MGSFVHKRDFVVDLPGLPGDHAGYLNCDIGHGVGRLPGNRSVVRESLILYFIEFVKKFMNSQSLVLYNKIVLGD